MQGFFLVAKRPKNFYKTTLRNELNKRVKDFSTKTEFAKFLGIKPSYLSDLLQGRLKGDNKINKWAKLWRVSPAYLRDEAEYQDVIMNYQPTKEALNNFPLLKYLIPAANDNDKQVVANMASMLVDRIRNGIDAKRATDIRLIKKESEK